MGVTGVLAGATVAEAVSGVGICADAAVAAHPIKHKKIINFISLSVLS
jgi:hypothetical protein